MKRKLINYELFDKLNENSLINIEKELVEAEDILAQALNLDGVELFSFDENTVIYETLDKNFVRASYVMKEGRILFENIEELIIDEESTEEKRKGILRKMFDEVLNNNTEKANALFSEYISLPSVRRRFLNEEQVWIEPKNKPHKKRKPQTASIGKRRAVAKRMHQKMLSPSEKKRLADLRKKLRSQYGPNVRIHIRSKPQMHRKMKEWANLTENVFNYLDYKEIGPVASMSDVKHDDKGNVVGLKIPNSKLRNESKILTFNWKTLASDNIILRSKMKNLAEDANFCRAMSDLKRCNALSDDEKTQVTLEAIVSAWPDILYLTQPELAKQISVALESSNQSNYDDETCDFMAEGILRTAFSAYDDKVNKIVTLSGLKQESTDDSYLDFQRLAEQFYTFLDESARTEMQVFVDLYNALTEVHQLAVEAKDPTLKSEAVMYLQELKSVIEQRVEPSLQLVGEVAEWLDNLVETNLETEDWSVSNTPHITVSGDHPRMAQLARQPYSPANDFSGNWGDPAPVSDGKNYKGGLADEMRSDAWGNWSNDNTYPQLENPYVPKSGNWTMPNEKGADKDGDNDWSRWQSGDTWPNLQNPYVPKGVTPQTYKAKSDDLIVDK